MSPWSILFVALVVVAAWRLVSGLVALRQTGRAKHQPIEIPVLGPAGSGKTLFIARLLYYLVHRPHESQQTDWAVNFLSEKDEAQVRGHALEKANDDQPPRPGLRGTRAMVETELERFDHTGSNEGSQTPENAYFKLYVSHDGHVEPHISTFVDLPGGYFEGSAHHASNLHPRLKAAHGLILMIDATRLRPDSEAERIQTHYDLYAEVVERVVEHCKRERLPIWIALTKGDLIDGSLTEFIQPGPLAAAELDRLLPRLAHLPTLAGEHIQRYATLTSSRLDFGHAATTMLRAWTGFVGDISDCITTEAAAERAESGRLIWRSLGWGALLVLFALLTWRQLSLDALPEVGEAELWQEDNLLAAADEVQRHNNNPIFFLDRPEMERRLSLLDQHYWQLVQEAQSDWLERFRRLAPAQRTGAVDELVDLLNRQEERLRSFIDFNTEPEKDEAARIMLRRSRFARHWLGDWRSANDAVVKDERSRTQGLAELALPSAETLDPVLAEPVRDQALVLVERALDAARRESLGFHHRDLVVAGSLSPLLAWRGAIAGDQWSWLLDSSGGNALLERYASYREDAWRRAWDLQNGAISDEAAVRDQALLLRQFKEEQERLKDPMPEEIRAQWEQRLVIALTEWKRVASQEAQDAQLTFFNWASRYLGDSGRALLALKNFEYRAQIRASALFDPQGPTGKDALAALTEWLARSIADLGTLPGAVAIGPDLTLWQQRIDTLETLAEPRVYTLQFSHLNCERERLADDHAEGWLDLYRPYVRVWTLEPNPQAFTRRLDRDVDPIELTWSPWTPIHFAFKDQDKSLDIAEGDTDDDTLSAIDGQIQAGVADGFDGLWSLAEWQGDACGFTAQIEPGLPEWLRSQPSQ